MLIIESFEIKNKLGLHARAAAKIVKVASTYRSDIFLERDGIEVNGKSLLGILNLACPKGSFMSIKVDGPDAEQAMMELKKLIEDKFGED
ncbi:MAG: HPr family phosphocarrier protein [Syntrophales bacterium]|jgi:phosphocarrier protein|nr:HPr family phosphocarrier protein [Syntrophales bacterium]NLN60249.1 HPr family phosphocarrier protein [Deltaproteobacteria bacterium]